MIFVSSAVYSIIWWIKTCIQVTRNYWNLHILILLVAEMSSPNYNVWQLVHCFEGRWPLVYFHLGKMNFQIHMTIVIPLSNRKKNYIVLLMHELLLKTVIQSLNFVALHFVERCLKSPWMLLFILCGKRSEHMSTSTKLPNMVHKGRLTATDCRFNSISSQSAPLSAPQWAS